jgi:hypothetical protein
MQDLVDQTAAKGKTTLILGNGKVIIEPARPFALVEGQKALEYLDNPVVSNCILVLKPGGRKMHACAGKGGGTHVFRPWGLIEVSPFVSRVLVGAEPLLLSRRFPRGHHQVRLESCQIIFDNSEEFCGCCEL